MIRNSGTVVASDCRRKADRVVHGYCPRLTLTVQSHLHGSNVLRDCV
jgi:hypothetical protein